MNKIAFVFPGQGSQYIGMGKDFYENFDIAKDIFAKTNKVLGYDLANIIFNGTDEDLKKTEITQPAIFTISYIIFQILQEQKGIKPDFVAGHSLGEYVALTASGILSFEDAINLVKKRGEFIKKSSEQNPGGMMAILGLSAEEVTSAISGLKDVEVANYNSPAQTVISYKGSDAYAEEITSKIKAKRIVKLNVSGPFHSSFMKPASDDLAQQLSNYTLNLPTTQIIFNYTAETSNNLDTIKSNIINQVKSSVQWTKTVEFMAKNGVSTIIEVGPGKVLSGLNKKIDGNLNILNVENIENLNALGENLTCQKN